MPGTTVQCGNVLTGLQLYGFKNVRLRDNAGGITHRSSCKEAGRGEASKENIRGKLKWESR